MYEKLLKIVTELGSPNVLIVGDFMLDIYTYGDALRISPEAPVPVLKIKNTETRAGGAGAVAADLAILGAKVYCVGLTGNDENGRILKNILTGLDIDVSGLLTLEDRPTISKQRLIGLAQHRHQQQLFRMDNENTTPISDEQADGVFNLFEEKLSQADIVCLQDYNKGLLTDGFCKRLIQQSRQIGKIVLIDPSPTADYAKYSGATAITPNRQETSIAVGFEINTKSDYALASEKLFKELNLQAVIITLDKEGAYLKTSSQSEIIPTRPRNVYDVTGAGDMVLASLAVSLAAGCDYKTAVLLANIAGGIEVEKFGVATVTVEEIINEIISQNLSKAGKVRTLDSLLPELKWHRSQGRKIVFTNGCFDVLHRGHIEYLKFCKNQGDIVVVGLNSDVSVKVIKGPNRPINNQYDRATVLAALESVDYIVIFNEPDPLNLIKQIKPDMLIKGQDWEGKVVIGAEEVKKNGGELIFAPLVKGTSSTATIEKIKSLSDAD